MLKHFMSEVSVGNKHAGEHGLRKLYLAMQDVSNLRLRISFINNSVTTAT